MFSWKYRVHAILILSVLAIIFVPQIMNKPAKNKIEATSAAATEFLTMVDTGHYADSWQICDAFLQQQIALNAWEAKLTQIRSALGPLVERELDDANFTAPADQLPNQDVILLEYKSQFESKSITEVVTLVQGKDNRWRVVGYFIQ